MFGGSSPFGQTSNSPFGSPSPSPFGQNNATNNPFAPKPFGATNPFGSQTGGGSLFGNSSTGVFGQIQPTLTSTPSFGATSSPGFGSTSPAPAFGTSTTSTFGGSSAFGQKPAFGGFGSNTQSQSPFGSTQQSQSPFGSTQQSQPSFSSNMFGSTSPFGTSSQPAFGSSTAPSFGSSTTPAFGSSTTPAFGATSNTTFGNTGSAFGASTGGGFGSTSTSVFGTGSAFGGATAPNFGVANTPSFGTSTTPAFGSGSNTTFGAGTASNFGQNTSSTSSSFSFGTGAFGQNTSSMGNTPFTSNPSNPATQSPFGTPNPSPFGGTTFGQPTLGAQRGGSRVAPFSASAEDPSNIGSGKLESISAMQVYKDKSHEELRWEDYQQGDKGGPNPASQTSAGSSFGVTAAQPNPFGSNPSPNIFSPSTSNPFNKQPSFGNFGTSSTVSSSPFSTPTPSLFSTTQTQTPSLFPASTSPFAPSSPAPFGTPNSNGIGSTSLFGSTPAQGTTASFPSTSSQQPSPFQSTFPSATNAFGQTGGGFGQTSFPSTNIFNTPSTGMGSGLSFNNPAFPSSTQSSFTQSTPSFSTSFQPAPQTGGAFNFSTFGQTPSAGIGGFGNGSSILGQTFGQSPASQSSAPLQPVAVTNPFGTLPAMPHMSIGNSGTSPTIQYGISSMPVVDKPTPVRISSFLTSRHLPQRRTRLPARKYNPKNDGSRVPFFSDDDEAPSTPKADAVIVPRDNPRALVIRPVDQWPPKSSMRESSLSVHENGKTSEEYEHFPNGAASEEKDHVARENGFNKEHSIKVGQNPGCVSDDVPFQKGDSYITLSGHRAGEAAIVYEHGADIEAMMPKLRHSDYYTEPRIQELAAKERADPGFCKRVKDFVVGRHNFGSIKFLGETDVRRLDLESLIQFNNREVIVYMDEDKKPPVGQGLNKPAEVTLLNIKCYDKKTGKQITEGPKIEKYKEMLKKKTEEQGAEFLSYEPETGEWKFRVSHFSKYVLYDDDLEGDAPPLDMMS